MTPIRCLQVLLSLLACGPLAMAAPPADRATLALVQSLGDEDPNVREQAAAQLGRLGPQAHAAVEPLVAALGHEDPYLGVGGGHGTPAHGLWWPQGPLPMVGGGYGTPV